MLQQITKKKAERPYRIGDVAIKLDGKLERKAVMEAVNGMKVDVASDVDRVVVVLGGRPSEELKQEYKDKFEDGKLSVEVLEVMFTA